MIKKRAMWLYPRAAGFNPSERWGHSACCSDGVLYVFGVRLLRGTHFGDVVALDLKRMEWSAVATSGERPGARDSHSAAVVGERMVVFGGTNGARKVNDLHVLDLRTMEWSRPSCRGAAPPPRESHTATAVGEGKLGNYLNDVHVLDVERMEWTSPEVRGSCRRFFVYGGDCGDRYHGEVDVLDLDSFTWSRLAVHGASPGVRAGHAVVNIGSKVYIIGGVGDKRYYGDVWVLDVAAPSWTQLHVRGRRPQGRFSHAAALAGDDIAIYGGCGEDERPLNELVILQLGVAVDHRNGRCNVSLCKGLSSHWNQERRRFLRGAAELPELSLSSGGGGGGGGGEPRAEQEEHSLSLSQHSSPSRSDQEQTNAAHNPAAPPGDLSTVAAALCQHRAAFEFQRPAYRCHNYGGGGLRTVDGAFDSGFLMTASVNGQIFRGVLFAPQAAARFQNQPMAALAAPPETSRRAAQPVKTCPPRASGDMPGLVLTLGGSVGGS
ncbi:unnamed protein product [Spirodela intermedia]|uniref:Uncharacterized protein n=1 Tax=Spirodela intermedia TaxID=51605 RepID=A0A7I8IWD4_SPIIN|nr:unnamed protein product [Spirodela intermedia]CAA6662179.1 unnamed protein product [Spirodela intermedia]